MPVMCNECGIRAAMVHYTEIVNNSKVAMDLCRQCAERKGIDVQKEGKYGLGDLVAGLIDSAASSETDRIGMVRCPSCGYDYSDFKKIGRFGCPDCYDAFEPQLVPMLRQVHGSTRHDGKAPAGTGARAAVHKEVMTLRDELSLAIAEEDYEHAAEIRDRIAEIESHVEKR